MLWTVSCVDGGAFTTFTEAGILGKIGLNNHGVGVCINILGSSSDGGLGGIPIHILLRLLLQSCQSLEDADALLRASAGHGILMFQRRVVRGWEGQCRHGSIRSQS